jgi:signal transduction histidine kinase
VSPRGALAAVRGLRPRDVRIAAIAAAIQIGGTVGASHRGATGRHGCWWTSSCSSATSLDVLGVALLALGPVALLLRRRYPRAVLGAVFIVTLAYVSLGYVQGPSYVSPAFALINAVIAGERIAAAVALVAGWALFLFLPAALGVTRAPSVLVVVAIAAWLLVLFAAAEAVRGRREWAAQTRQARQQEALRKADEERLRVARELHDVLAHNISLINVQSGVALHLIDERPEQARIALSAINEASADALRGIRSALGVLRGSGEQPPLEPMAGLAGLDNLMVRTKAAGVDVSLAVHGDQRPLPASVDLAAFRIVQESLTNIVRHAGASAADVQLTYADEGLIVQVEDNGHGEPSPSAVAGSGSGIAGMRERAAALGGEFEAGPRPAGGFRVRARLPLGRER